MIYIYTVYTSLLSSSVSPPWVEQSGPTSQPPYPLVNCHITMEKHHAIFDGKHRPFLWPFSKAILT